MRSRMRRMRSSNEMVFSERGQVILKLANAFVELIEVRKHGLKAPLQGIALMAHARAPSPAAGQRTICSAPRGAIIRRIAGPEQMNLYLSAISDDFLATPTL